MRNFMMLPTLLTCLFCSSFDSQSKKQLIFKIAKGHVVKVSESIITYDGKPILKMKYDDLIYGDKANRIIEDHNTTFLFLAIDGSPNINRFEVYEVTANSAKLVADAILSSIKDYDGDGYLEFGGQDLTEVYPNPDSMYYVPTAYYQIKNGRITPDDKLTKETDIKINGVYLKPSMQNNTNGNCCKVIPVPRKRRNYHN